MTRPSLSFSGRGRRGGRRNPGPRHTVAVVQILRELRWKNPNPPPYSTILSEVRRRCPWSRFNYAIWTKTYLPRWRKGAL